MDRALEAVDNMKFIGVVEGFSDSLRKLEDWLAEEGFVDVALSPVEENVSRSTGRSLEDKINDIRVAVGDEIFDLLVAENESDIVLYDRVLNREGLV